MMMTANDSSQEPRKEHTGGHESRGQERADGHLISLRTQSVFPTSRTIGWVRPMISLIDGRMDFAGDRGARDRDRGTRLGEDGKLWTAWIDGMG